MEENEEGWTDVSPDKDGKNPWIYRGLILIGLALIAIDLYQAYRCLQNPCCELHWFLIDKHAVGCGIMPGGALKWPV